MLLCTRAKARSTQCDVRREESPAAAVSCVSVRVRTGGLALGSMQRPNIHIRAYSCIHIYTYMCASHIHESITRSFTHCVCYLYYCCHPISGSPLLAHCAQSACSLCAHRYEMCARSCLDRRCASCEHQCSALAYHRNVSSFSPSPDPRMGVWDRFLLPPHLGGRNLAAASRSGRVLLAAVPSCSC